LYGAAHRLGRSGCHSSQLLVPQRVSGRHQHQDLSPRNGSPISEASVTPFHRSRSLYRLKCPRPDTDRAPPVLSPRPADRFPTLATARNRPIVAALARSRYLITLVERSFIRPRTILADRRTLCRHLCHLCRSGPPIEVGPIPHCKYLAIPREPTDGQVCDGRQGRSRPVDLICRPNVAPAPAVGS